MYFSRFDRLKFKKAMNFMAFLMMNLWCVVYKMSSTGVYGKLKASDTPL